MSLTAEERRALLSLLRSRPELTTTPEGKIAFIYSITNLVDRKYKSKTKEERFKIIANLTEEIHSLIAELKEESITLH